MIRFIILSIALTLFGFGSFAQTFDDYFKLAAENNPGLKAQYNEYEAALQKVDQVKALPDPTFSFGYFISPAETKVGPQKAKLSLSQMFPWFGTLKAQGDAAALMAEAKYQNFIDARNKLRLELAAAYFPLYELNEWIRIEQENINVLKSYKTIANQKFNEGAGSMVDVLRVDIMLKDSETNLEILKTKETPLIASFNKLLNRPENEAVSTGDSLKTILLPTDFRKDSLTALNPKIKALSLKLQASLASERAAKKQGLPKLGVGLDYVIVDKGSNLSLPDNGKDIVMPMISISIPIFRSKYNALVKEAQLTRKGYENKLLDETNTLVSEYEMAMFQLNQQEQLISLYQKQIETTKQSINLLLTSYANSGKEFEEVLRMQQQLLKYQKMHISALVQYQIAVEKINYLTSNIY
ncbi:TolC family protein [Tenuifilum thalassicum]|uniref:TolC family protein n=1 Tax=Tenuifilum thalassicum TaxID=2590900 RepID=A0A7D4CSW2_9BACT|nr:TolC family protein [Tenuifilum thalassicum]QKG81105.1 TolC family protein [Tenuifilum thalassicum]